MKKGLIIWIHLTMLFAAAGFAQPGYRGKKLSVSAEIGFLPAVTNATYSKAPGMTTFNTTKEVSADYVLGRRNSIGLSYKNCRTSNLRSYNQENQTISPTKVYSNAIGVQYKIFKRKSGNLAPLGKYKQIGAHLMFNNAQDVKKLTDGTQFRTYALSIGTGRNKILSNKLILHYGLEFSHVFTGLSKEGFTGATYYYKDDVQTMAQYRLWRHSLLNFKLGLGFLAL